MSDSEIDSITRFHSNHGTNVLLCEDNTVAFRKDSFNDALTFTENPIKAGEIFLIEIQKTEPGWTGHMRIGFTQLNPGANCLADLPTFSMPDLILKGDSWIWPINKSITKQPVVSDRQYHALDSGHRQNINNGTMEFWLRIFHLRYNLSILEVVKSASGTTDEGSRIGVVFLPMGDVAEIHYIINGVDQGVFAKRIPYYDAPLYGVVDVYGTTKQVKIVQICRAVPSLKKSCRMTILKHLNYTEIRFLPLPKILQNYLLYIQ